MVTGKHSGKHVVGGRVPDYHVVGRRNGYYRDNDDNEHDNDLELNKDNDNDNGDREPINKDNDNYNGDREPINQEAPGHHPLTALLNYNSLWGQRGSNLIII